MPVEVIGPGYVRSTNTFQTKSLSYYLNDIVFETDGGDLRSVRLLSARPIPVWQGMHCRIFRRSELFISVERLGADAPFRAGAGRRGASGFMSVERLDADAPARSRLQHRVGGFFYKARFGGGSEMRDEANQ